MFFTSFYQITSQFFRVKLAGMLKTRSKSFLMLVDLIFLSLISLTPFNTGTLNWNDYWFDLSCFISSIILIFPVAWSILALLICVENSFWHQNSTFLNAFSDAFRSYERSGTRQRVEAGVRQLGIYPEDIKGKAPVLKYFQTNQEVREEKYKTALIDLILANCLSI